MVATGHAQTSPEGTKVLFPYSTVSSKQDEHDFPYQRIPDMCLEAHQCRESAKKIEIVKQVQSIVINSESSKDDLRDCGAIQALCRLLSLNRDPLILQHVLASLASLSFENNSNCDEVSNQGGLQMMCYLLGKVNDSAVQENIAWALKNLSSTERNQNEARIRGGIKALCELLKSASDEKVLEGAAWAVGSLVQDNVSNCQAVQECGGLKTLCELVAKTISENVLERTTWALGMLATDLKNRNFIRQYGGIENICKKLQESPSQQIIKQCALTLKTLASNNQHNRDIMTRLGMVGTLRSFMTDETQRLGIISRRVCGDLLQRLLGSAAGNFESTIPQASAPVSRTQGCSTSPGGDKNPNPETRAGNGLVDKDFNGGGDDLDGLPPLEGEDSDEENESTVSVNASPPAKVLVKGDAKDNVGVQGNAVTSARPLSHPRASTTMGDENIAPFRLHPKTVWSQTRELVRVSVKLRGVERQQTEITARRLLFRTQMGSSLYELDLELFEDIDYERSVVVVKGAEVQILLKKRNHAVWTRLLKSKEKLPYVSIDFDRWEVWSSSEEDEGDDNTNARVEPANPSNSRRDSDDRGRSKQVFLPEMLVSDSNSDEESVASDIDYLDFR